MLQCCHIFVCKKKKPWPKPTGVLEHCREGETNHLFSILFGAFPSGCIPKATKDVNVQKFPSRTNFRKLSQRIPRTSEAARI